MVVVERWTMMEGGVYSVLFIEDERADLVTSFRARYCSRVGLARILGPIALVCCCCSLRPHARPGLCSRRVRETHVVVRVCAHRF